MTMDAKTNHLTNNFAKLLHLNGHNAAINMFGVNSNKTKLFIDNLLTMILPRMYDLMQ